jgi:hypothetical protein
MMDKYETDIIERYSGYKQRALLAEYRLQKKVAELEKEIDRRNAEWRKFVELTHDEQIDELERRWQKARAWAAAWKRKATQYRHKYFQAFEQLRTWDKRALKAEAERDELRATLNDLVIAVALELRHSEDDEGMENLKRLADRLAESQKVLGHK